MMRFTFHFLGKFEVIADTNSVTDFHSDKARALLAYLALENKVHTRQELAVLFWPDIGDRYARANLRNTLHRLRQTLDAAAEGAADQLLIVTRQAVQFNAVKAGIDVLHFQTLLEVVSAQQSHRSTGQHELSTSEQTSACLEQLEEAVELYQGELLAGFGVPDAADFEEWLLLRREMLHQRAILAFHTLCTEYESTGDYERAHEVASRLLVLDPYRENTYRQIMGLLAQMGQPDHALHYLEQMRLILREELGVEPSAQTLALAKQIAASELVEVAVLQDGSVVKEYDVRVIAADPNPNTSLPSLDLRDVPDPGPFFGRELERQQITKWLNDDYCRLVALLGIGGMGKTSLAAQSLRELSDRAESVPIETVIWRSLLNAPTLAELLPPILQILSNHQLTIVPDSLDEQLRMLLDFLRKQRVLLVLDNMESILDADQAGAYRVGYEPYDQLIQQIATHNHQSHLLLTSRERPRGYECLEKDSQFIQSLQLNGLNDDAGHALLAQRGLNGIDHEESMLIKRYSGNPLALKTVADTVDEIFGGDIAEFLAEESLVFDDMRTVLDQQFDRLSGLEQEILFWLVVEREATSVAILRENLLTLPPQRVLVEALRNLQRRSLIERFETGFAMQNVVTEYLTNCLVERVRYEIETGNLYLLHHHPLIKAKAKKYVRETQTRLILGPICTGLVEKHGLKQVVERLQQILVTLRESAPRAPSYAGGNILNMLLYLKIDITEFDFSQCNVWHAFLQGRIAHRVNFSEADLSYSSFTHNFGYIFSLAFDPSGTYLAAGANDGEIRLWRHSDGQPERRLKGHLDRTLSLAFRPHPKLGAAKERSLLASSSLDRTIRLWDIDTGDCLYTLYGHGAGIDSVAFSPDGYLLATGCRDHMVRLWDMRSLQFGTNTTETVQPIVTLEHHTDWVQAIAFHPAGHLLASASEDSTICLWNIEAITQQIALSDALSGQVVPEVRLIPTILQRHATKVVCLAFSPDGSLLASGDSGGTIRLWDINRGRVLKILQGHIRWVRSIAFNADGSLLASGSADTTVRLWRIPSGEVLNTLHGHKAMVRAVAISRDDTILASGGEDGAIHLWDLQTHGHNLAFNTLLGNLISIRSVEFSPNGTWLAAGDQSGRVFIWELKDSAPKLRHILIGHSQTVRMVAFSPDGQLLASTSNDKTVCIWDLLTGQRLDVLGGHTKSLLCVAFNPKGAIMATAGFDGDVYLWDIRNIGQSRLFRICRGHLREIEGLSFDPRGEFVVSGSGDGEVRLWPLDTKSTPDEFVQILEDHPSEIWSMVLSPQGELLATAGRDGNIQLWDMHSSNRGALLRRFSGHIDAVRNVTFSPDGQYLASSSVDRTVRLWNVGNGQEIDRLPNETRNVTFVVFGPDGKRVAIGRNDGAIRLWHLESKEYQHTLRIPGPYEGMNITGVTGITEVQREALKALGAVEDSGATG